MRGKVWLFSYKDSIPQRQCILDSGGMRGLEHLLHARETPRQEAAVQALAALTVGNADVLEKIVASRQLPCCLSYLARCACSRDV